MVENRENIIMLATQLIVHLLFSLSVGYRPVRIPLKLRYSIQNSFVGKIIERKIVEFLVEIVFLEDTKTLMIMFYIFIRNPRADTTCLCLSSVIGYGMPEICVKVFNLIVL